MCRLDLVRLLQASFSCALLVSACPSANAESVCSDTAVKDFFLQGGQQVLEESHLAITSLSQDEEVARSDKSFTCRYLMELSDRSRKWVRFTYSRDEDGQPAIDFEEETHSTLQKSDNLEPGPQDWSGGQLRALDWKGALIPTARLATLHV